MIHLKKNDERTALPNLSVSDALALRHALAEGYSLVEVVERDLNAEPAGGAPAPTAKQAKVERVTTPATPPTIPATVPATLISAPSKPPETIAPSATAAPDPKSTARRLSTAEVILRVLAIIEQSGRRGANVARFRKKLPGATDGQLRHARETLRKEGKIWMRGTKGSAKYFRTTPEAEVAKSA